MTVVKTQWGIKVFKNGKFVKNISYSKTKGRNVVLYTKRVKGYRRSAPRTTPGRRPGGLTGGMSGGGGFSMSSGGSSSSGGSGGSSGGGGYSGSLGGEGSYSGGLGGLGLGGGSHNFADAGGGGPGGGGCNNGFCVRGSAINNFYGQIAQSAGIDHVDIAYNGGVIYVGRGGGAERIYQTVQLGDKTWPLSIKGSGELQHGNFKGCPCKSKKNIPDEFIVNCLKNRKKSPGKNCQGDVQDAVNECCLKGYTSTVGTFFPTQ
jgi:hypothetical protein